MKSNMGNHVLITIPHTIPYVESGALANSLLDDPSVAGITFLAPSTANPCILKVRFRRPVGADVMSRIRMLVRAIPTMEDASFIPFHKPNER
jgi:hypothetical protein